jgi:micrococcal nuclease
LKTTRDKFASVAIGLCLLLGMGWGYQYWQKMQAARPDYEQSMALQQSSGVVNGVDDTKMPQTETWEVVSITDGDTIAVRQGNREDKIRFCGIDAPEVAKGQQVGQPYGAESQAYLQQLIAQAGGQVGVVPVERDRYGRMVAEVFLMGRPDRPEQFVQEEMLMAGLAYVYPQYVDRCWNARSYSDAESIAKEKKAGVWSGQELEKPWEFRRALRER